MESVAWNVLKMAQSSNVSTEDVKKVGTTLTFAALGYLATKLFRKKTDPQTLQEMFIDPVEALHRNVIICNSFEKLQHYRKINPQQFSFMITSIDKVMFIEQQLAKKVIIGTLDDVDDLMVLINFIRESMNRFLYSAKNVARLNMKSLRLIRNALKDIIQQLPIFTLSIETMCYRYNEHDILHNAEKDVERAVQWAKRHQNNC